MSFGTSFGGYYGGVGMPGPNRRITEPSTYLIITAPAELPVSLEQVKAQLAIPLTQTSQDALLTLYIEASRDFFQSYTGRILINTGYRTYFNMFYESFELRRSRLQTLEVFEYLDTDNVFVTVDASIYYTTEESDYSRVLIQDIADVPSDKTDKFQSIKFEFTAGYGESQDDIPSDIQLALLNQIAMMYANRGDCSGCSANPTLENLPVNARLTYEQYKIPTLYGGSYRGGA